MRRVIGAWLDRRSTAWAIGVALPLLMVLFDPAVFRSTSIGDGLSFLGRFKAFGYVGIALGVATLAFSLLVGRSSTFVAGSLAAACLLSLGLGVVLLPFSLLGALFAYGLGLLGLSPFLTAVIFGWWSRRTFRSAPLNRRWLGAAAGLALFAAIPAFAQRAAETAYRGAIDDILSGQPERREAGTTRLERWRGLIDVDRMALRWSRQSLAVAYSRVAHADIAERATQLLLFD